MTAISKYSQVLDEAKAFIYDNYAKEEISRTRWLPGSISAPAISAHQPGDGDLCGVSDRSAHEKAKELLMCSNLKTSGNRVQVGYKDSHYFGYLFKKPLDVRLRSTGGSREGHDGKMETGSSKKGRTEQMRRIRALEGLGHEPYPGSPAPGKSV